MYNSKLYAILEHFDKYEQNRCRKYIQSPYFNRSEELVELFEVLISAINGENGVNLEKEYVWQKIQADKEYDDVRFRKYCSDLLKLIEGYLAQQIYEGNPLHQATYLMESVGKKKMKKLYSTAMRTARRLSKQQNHKPSSYYFYQYEIEKNYYDLTDFETNRTEKTNVEDIITNLDYFYLAEKLRLYCSVLSRQYVVSYEYELLFIDEIVNHIKKHNYENVPAISIYYQIYLTQTEVDEESHYYRLKSLLNKHSLDFPHKEANAMYSYAMNYCIRKSNRGQLNFLGELFELYKDLLDKELIFSDGELSPWHFKNIIGTGLRLGKFKWVENFINQYNDRLHPKYRDNAVTYNLAQVYFYQKEHDKVIQLLQEVEYDDVAYNLGSKAMLLATYYETDEVEPLFSLFESFRAYLNRHKDIPVNRRKNYGNLIKFTKKLTRTMPGDEKAINKLKEEIKNTKNIASVNWLREKIAELED
ncbi:MAG: hypothetical protein J5I98_25515 [Phaeodactylibacter sp.]|nr:hypothetical protein [Phaeodactylibacter sp.]